ncbi:MAG: LacI family DNA-binding transcriptional regulator [Pseudomonadota bacterium]
MILKRKTGPVQLIDVAKRAGVSKSTVSNVLNSRPGFSEKTRRKVEKAIADLNYVTDKAASSLRSSKQWTVSYLIRDTAGEFLSDTVTARITSGLSETLSERGYDLQIQLCTDKVLNPNDIFRRRSTDAVVLTCSGTPSETNTILSSLRQMNVPIILIKNKCIGALDDLAIIDQDDCEAGRLIVEHLASRNARNFWYISSKVKWYTLEGRFSYIKKALADLDVDSRLRLIRADSESYHDVIRAVMAFAENDPPPLNAASLR